MDIKRFAMLAVAGLAVAALPAKADTIKSEDASVELTVPNGWRQTKPIAPAIRIQATNGRGTILVRIAVKEDYKDLKSFAQVASSKFLRHLVDAEPKTEDVQVNGSPAIRISAEGTQTNGLRRGYVMTFFDANGTFVEVVGIANASAFSSEQQTLADLAGKVKVLAAAAGTTPPPAPATTTPPATPSTTSSKQPPPSRSPH
jgi:hypothetical protein